MFFRSFKRTTYLGLLIIEILLKFQDELRDKRQYKIIFSPKIIIIILSFVKYSSKNYRHYFKMLKAFKD